MTRLTLSFPEVLTLSFCAVSLHYIQYTKHERDLETGATLDMSSKLNLIDLAGSENANSAGAGGSVDKTVCVGKEG